MGGGSSDLRVLAGTLSLPQARVGLLLMCYWYAIGVLLVCYWYAIGMPLVCYGYAMCMLLVCW